MRMRRKMKHIIQLLFLFPILVLGFQNCSQSGLEFEDLSATQLRNDFDFEYKTQPSHYLQTLLLLEKDPNPSKKFKLVVLVGTPSYSSNTGMLNVRVESESNLLLCPQENIDLSSGQKVWEINCVPPSSYSRADVHLTVSGTNKDFAISKSYTMK